jgi:DNA-binding IclR family transcriptional regulator
MLAFEQAAAVEAILGRPLQPRTPKTDTNPEHLRQALAHIRKTGYALEDEQCEVGMRSIAAPVRNAEGRVVAAIGVAGPQQRMSDAMLERFLPLLVETATTISARLGHKAPAIY